MSVKDLIREKIDRCGSLTPFRKKVYKAVLEIPEGETRSYKWVAETIGSPRADRAVGNVLNMNPFIPEVPCHRVIRSDGSISGYAGGVKRKLTMLNQEGVKF